MNEYDATEIAYKNGYEKAVQDVFADIEREIKNHGITYAQRKIAELKKKYTKQTIENAERCIACGEIIPEGRQMCLKCEKATSK